MASTPAKRRVNTCMVCLEVYDPAAFVYTCPRCPDGQCCPTCLKGWFIESCWNEVKMPPKCCTAIPLAVVSDMLTVAEAELYKAKFEEWSTADRRYCPIPSCSAFIPPSLLLESPEVPEGKVQKLESFQHAAEPVMRKHTWIDLELYNSGWNAPAKPLKPKVTCPKCSVSVCTKCRSLSHPGDCSANDIDPHLQAALSRWNVKRCPKCRAGVRKVYGCSHLECRCGAHFCWECMQPMNVCDGRCEDDDEVDYGASDRIPIAEDDFDRKIGFREGDGYDFGNEPRGIGIETWLCPHDFYRSVTRAKNSASEPPMECHRCFRLVTRFQDDRIIELESSKGVDAASATWQCLNGHVTCHHCPPASATRRIPNPPLLWTCDCRSVSCTTCEEEVLHKQKLLDDEKGWECQCTIVVCGACKPFA